MSRRGPKRNPGRLQHDLIIYVVLSQGEPKKFWDARAEDMRISKRCKRGSVFVGEHKMKPTSVSQAARELAEIWGAEGYHVSWQSIRARYNKLKKLGPDQEAVSEALKRSL